jgi:hypothetical protein
MIAATDRSGPRTGGNWPPTWGNLMETLADLARLRVERLGEIADRPLDIRPDFDPIVALRRPRGLRPLGNEGASSVRHSGPARTLAGREAWRLGIARRVRHMLSALAWAHARPPRTYRILHDWRPLACLEVHGRDRRYTLAVRLGRLLFSRRTTVRLARSRPLAGLALRLWALRGRPGLRGPIVFDNYPSPTP